MEDLRPKTILFCAILAFAIALSVLLRGRRAVHLLFAAFATALAFWYASQSLTGFFHAEIWVRATGVLTVLLPQFAVHLFQSLVPAEAPALPRRLTRFATIVGQSKNAPPVAQIQPAARSGSKPRRTPVATAATTMTPTATSER